MTLLAVTFQVGDWGTWLLLAFVAGLLASIVARPQGAGCFGFGCFGNLIIGGLGAIVGGFLVGLCYHGEANGFLAFAIAFAGALLVLYIGQGIDRLLRRNVPPPEPAHPPLIVDSTAREAARDEDE
jgi:uncharacterized membrane protein YeaQ/YmgE (transglycosylase-associated protein family)